MDVAVVLQLKLIAGAVCRGREVQWFQTTVRVRNAFQIFNSRQREVREAARLCLGHDGVRYPPIPAFKKITVRAPAFLLMQTQAAQAAGFVIEIGRIRRTLIGSARVAHVADQRMPAVARLEIGFIDADLLAHGGFIRRRAHAQAAKIIPRCIALEREVRVPYVARHIHKRTNDAVGVERKRRRRVGDCEGNLVHHFRRITVPRPIFGLAGLTDFDAGELPVITLE